jgi:hypothetical protein
MARAFRKMTLALLVISTVFVSFSALAQSSNPQTGYREASRTLPSVVIQWNDAHCGSARLKTALWRRPGDHI